MKRIGYLILVAGAILLVQGCAVNVVVAPHAVLDASNYSCTAEV